MKFHDIRNYIMVRERHCRGVVIMRKRELEKYRKRLLKWRESLLSEIRRQRDEAQELKDAGVADFGDLGLKDNIGGILHLLNDSQREEIMQIDEALTLLQEGTYGVCQECGSPIGKDRLDAYPLAQYCLSCKHEDEKQATLTA
jgi:DnaK suppressor protein